MEKIEIRLKGPNRRIFFITGSIWIALGLFGLFSELKFWVFIMYFVLGALYIIIPLRSKIYITIDNGKLRKHGLFPKSIPLNEVERIRYFAGDYTLYAPGKKLTIDTFPIEDDAKIKLETVLKSLNAAWEKPMVRSFR